MNHCKACGMPLDTPEVCFEGDLNSDSCAYCTNEDGTLKSCGEIFEGGVQFFMGATDSPRDLAERLTRTNMCSLPWWNEHPDDCLNGEKATDEEFKDAISKLQ